MQVERSVEPVEKAGRLERSVADVKVDRGETGLNLAPA